MSAIFGFTFHIGQMTEVLTPDIYRAHCPDPLMQQGGGGGGLHILKRMA